MDKRLATMHRTPRALIHIAVILLGAVIGFSAIIGCGVKAPPQPPQPPPLSAVQDLTATYSERGEGTIILTWRDDGDHATIVAYEIYASRSDLDQDPCQGCPEMFEKIDRLVVENPKAAGQIHEFSLAAQAEARYRFKVVAQMPGGALGPDSNVAVIEVNK